jgi:lipoprotein signal peptidase
LVSRKSSRHALFSFWHGTLPTLPIWGGKEFTFNAIFNVADMAISTGVGILIFSTKHFINNKFKVII